MDAFVKVRGLTTRYRQAGEGPPTILLHGASLGSSAEVWEELLEPLASYGLHVLAVDFPGYGLSEAPAELKPGYQREHVLAFMAELGIPRAHLVGHSMSGGVCVRLAAEHADRVNRIVVVGTGSVLPPLPGVPVVPDGGSELDHEPTLEESRADLAATVFHEERLTPQFVARRHQLSVGANFAAARARSTAPREPREDPPVWQRLDRFPTPTLLIYGEQDRGHAAERARLALEQVPGLNLHLLPQCKHVVQYDQPDELVRLVGEFLVAASGTPGPVAAPSSSSSSARP